MSDLAPPKTVGRQWHDDCMSVVNVFVEVGSKRVFASAAEWTGWCRTAKTEELALESLLAYAPRYEVVARHAGIAFPSAINLTVVEHLPGDATTDFGAPSTTAEAEREKLTAPRAKRQVALVRAAWAVLEEVAAQTPAELRKGPRGGGRDRDKMLDHVVGAESAYARKIGVKVKQPAFEDPDGVAAMREEIAAVLGSTSDGSPVVERGWTSRYAARRIAWHALDHAWEMQDRSEP
jgi:hypothetical protein